MKILRLDLVAFGPFTDVVLDLEAGQEGLHVVYGPNEAGKSSALRALEQFLFGIPLRSQDGFLHPYARLRVGAALRNGGGRVLECLRRKGNKNTLYRADDATPLEPGALAKFVGGLDQASFRTMFGIDHAQLVTGGEEIVKGGGDIGQILFAAGSGIADLRAVQKRLEDEASELFLPQGKVQRINRHLKELDLERKAARDDRLSSSEWLAHHEAYRKAEHRKAALERELAAKSAEVSRLSRIQKALPALAHRKALLDQLGEVASAVVLPPDFGNQRRDLEKELHLAASTAEQLAADLELTGQAIAALDVPAHLVEQAEAIEDLNRRLGTYRQAAADRPGLVTARAQFEAQARAVLSDLGHAADLDRADELRLTAAQRVRMQNLAHAELGLKQQCQARQEAVDGLAREIDEVQAHLASLEPPRDPTELRAAVGDLERAGEPDEARQAAWEGLGQAQRQAAIDLGALALWTGALDELEALPVPGPESIDRWEKSFTGLDNRIEQLRAGVQEAQADRLELDREVQRLRMEQEVPTEEDLQQARRRRDEGWELVHRAWREGAADERAVRAFLEAGGPGQDLAGAYEQSVQVADQIADRLRREAERVERQASLLADRKKGDVRLATLAERLNQAQAELAGAQAAWSALWQPCRIAPFAPGEMRAWTRRRDQVAAQARAIREREAEIAQLDQRIGAHRRTLGECLLRLDQAAPAPQETLRAIRERSQALVRQIDGALDVRRACERDLAKLQAELPAAKAHAERAAAQLADWRLQWKEAMQKLGQREDATPAEANTVIDAIGNLFTGIEKAHSERQRIDAIDTYCEQFAADVRSLAERLAPALVEVAVDQAVAELHGRLRRGLAAKERLDALAEQQGKQASQLRETRAATARLTQRLASMCQQARCLAPQELPAAEERSARRLALEKGIREADEKLLELSAGASLNEFLGEAGEVDPDQLAGQLVRLEEEVAQLKAEKDQLMERIGEEKTVLKAMDGRAQAAEAAERAQNLLAEIASQVDEYVRLRLASAVLRGAIAAYRQKNEDPVLARASRLFADLTAGSFRGVQAGYDERDQAVLVGLRAGTGDVVGVDAMSDGTRDQLYLALRLASLEVYLGDKEPIPFIVDDILIRFDDQRSVATLQVLAGLSRRTQVIFFTHHEHLVELAESTLPEGVVFVHRLDRFAPNPKLRPVP